MRHSALQAGLVLLGFAVVGVTVYALPLLLEFFQSVSYRFVLIFLVIVLASNILAKIACRFLNA